MAFPRKGPHSVRHRSANHPGSVQPSDLARHSSAARTHLCGRGRWPVPAHVSPEDAPQRSNAFRAASANGRSGPQVPAPPPVTSGDAQDAPGAGKPGPPPSEVSWLLVARCSVFPVLARLLPQTLHSLPSPSSPITPPPFPFPYHGFRNQAVHPRHGFFIHRLGLGEENRRQACHGHWRRADGLRHRAGETPSGNTPRSLSCPP